MAVWTEMYGNVLSYEEKAQYLHHILKYIEVVHGDKDR